MTSRSLCQGRIPHHFEMLTMFLSELANEGDCFKGAVVVVLTMAWAANATTIHDDTRYIFIRHYRVATSRRFLEPRKQLHTQYMTTQPKTLTCWLSNVLAPTVLQQVLYRMYNVPDCMFQEVVQWVTLWVVIIIIIVQSGPTPYTCGKFSGSPKKTTKSSTSSASPISQTIKSPANSPQLHALKAAAKSSASAKTTLSSRPIANAPLEIVIRHYTDNAGLLHPECTSTQMHQVIVRHNSRPSLLFRFKNSLQAFIERKKVALTVLSENDPDDAEAKEDAENWPLGVDDLATRGIIWRNTMDTDPMKVGFVKWQICIYCDGAEEGLNNTLNILDMFWVDCLTKPDFADKPKPEVHIFNKSAYDLNPFVDASFYQTYLIQDTAPPTSMHIFAVVPPEGLKIVEMVIRPVSDDTALILWHGNTYPYNSSCNDLDLSSGRFNADGEVCDAPDGEYWRFIVDLVFPTEIYRLNTILGSGAFHNVAMQVHLEDGTTEGSPIRAYVQTLMHHEQYRMRQ